MATPLHPHFREFLKLCQESRVSCLVVGGYAVNFHGYAQPTGDIDIWVDRTPENTRRVAAVVGTFLRMSVDPADFEREGYGYQIGVSPVRIDLHTEIGGVTFREALARAVEEYADGLHLRFLSFEDLIRNKMSTGHLKDAADVEELLRGRGISPEPRSKDAQ